ncbi:putative bifunctional diguanylate cyclase/phosphodiesterase [Roseovarius mucosus]|uniref:putative bifunctional diguanylate cyclase/phosphodiesterase n=1 Tax=Roseovarius mucosus TaxID=215743 RepID=UPI003F72ECDE
MVTAGQERIAGIAARLRARHWLQSLALIAAAGLATHWFGLAALLLALPLTLLALALSDRRQTPPLTDEAARSAPLRAAIADSLSNTRQGGTRTACLLLQIDEFETLTHRHGLAAADRVILQSLERLARMLRPADQLFDLGDGRLGVLLAPKPGLTLGPLLALAERLRTALAEPIALDATTLHISASLGLCLDAQVPARTATALYDACHTALHEAQRHGPAAIRAYGRGMAAPTPPPRALAQEVTTALQEGRLITWFQPQICTDTGQITGFEALARWQHPTAGLIAPAEFLPLLAASGRMEVLGDAMLANALRALQTWDHLGLDIPCVGLNLSPEELRNPTLPEKFAWELDRCDLPAHRLVIEVLETVVATSADDVITRNIAALARMGCPIDLDDYGTGHASLATIRRFAVHRLKIDRSYVTAIDRDPDQQRMVGAILSMADRLGLATLAEGVETAGELAMLAQLGCAHVQGFGIARPMPLAATPDWIAAHRAKLGPLPRIARAKG